jgi:hypothetical protein
MRGPRLTLTLILSQKPSYCSYCYEENSKKKVEIEVLRVML